MTTTTTKAAAMPATCNEATTATDDEAIAHPRQHLLRNGPVMLKLRAWLRVSPGAWLFFRQILDHLHTHGEAWPSLPTLMRETGYTSPTSASRFVRELAQAGVLRARLVRQVGGWPLYHYSLGPTLIAWLEALDQDWPRNDGPTVARAAPRLEPPSTIGVGPGELPPMVEAEPPPTTVTKSQISDLRDLRSRSPLPPEPIEVEQSSRGAQSLISVLEEPREVHAAADVEERRNVVAARLRADVTDVLSHWRATLVPGDEGKLETKERVTLIRELLYGDADDGGCFTAQELKWAIDAAKTNPWWSDASHPWRRRITVLFKSTDRIGELATRGRELAERARKSAATAAVVRGLDAEGSRATTRARPSERISPEQMIEDLEQRGLWLGRRADTAAAATRGVAVAKSARALQAPLDAPALTKGHPPLAGLSSGPPRVDSAQHEAVKRAAVLAAIAEFRAMPCAAKGKAA